MAEQNYSFGDKPPRNWRDYPQPIPTAEDEANDTEDGDELDREFAEATLGGIDDEDDDPDVDFSSRVLRGIVPVAGWDIVMRGSVGERGNSTFSASFDEAEHPRGGKENPGQFAPKGSGSESAKPSKPIPRATGGEFTKSGSGVSGLKTHSRLQSIIEAPVKGEHALVHAAQHGAKSAFDWLKRKVSSGKELPASAKSIAIGKGLSLLLRTGSKIYMAPWVAGNVAVEAVAKAKGLNDEDAKKVRALCLGYDVLACKAVFLGLEHTAGKSTAAASTMIPVASMTYLAYSTATNPLAVSRAAHAAVKSIAKKAKKVVGFAADDHSVNNSVGILADAIKRHSGDDWFMAVLPWAMEESDNISDAVALAEQCEQSNVATFAAYTESDHPRGQPDNAGQFAPKGGSSGGQAEGDGNSRDETNATKRKVNIVKNSEGVYEPASYEDAKSIADAINESVKELAPRSHAGVAKSFSDKLEAEYASQVKAFVGSSLEQKITGLIKSGIEKFDADGLTDETARTRASKKLVRDAIESDPELAAIIDRRGRENMIDQLDGYDPSEANAMTVAQSRLARNAIRQAATVVPLRVRDGIRLSADDIADNLLFGKGKLKDDDRKRIADTIHDANIEGGAALDIEKTVLNKAQKRLGTRKLDLLNNDALDEYLHENPGKEIDADDIIRLLGS